MPHRREMSVKVNLGKTQSMEHNTKITTYSFMPTAQCIPHQHGCHDDLKCGPN